MAAIIFDFDGTIADSFDYVVDFLATEARVGELTRAERVALQDMSMVAIARKLGHPWWRLPLLLIKGRKVMSNVITQLRPFDGMPEVIHKLHAEGHELFVLSTNISSNLRAFLERHELEKNFLELYGSVSAFGKASALRSLVKEHQFEMSDCIYIGDETRDVDAAVSIGMRMIAVEWGFARLQDLKEQHPTAIARTPADIIAILEEL